MDRLANWRVLILLPILLAMFILSHCGDDGGDEPSPPSAAALIRITVTPENPSIPAGPTQQFAAGGAYSDGTSQDITTQVYWSSSDTSIATINSGGMATAVAAGTANVTATLGSIAGNARLTVNSAILSSMAVIPDAWTCPPIDERQFSAIGTYSDGTSYDITDQANWRSSDPNVATVSKTGLVKCCCVPGSTTITAEWGSSIVGNAEVLWGHMPY